MRHVRVEKFHSVEERTDEKVKRISDGLYEAFIHKSIIHNQTERNRRTQDLLSQENQFAQFDLKFSSSETANVPDWGLHEKTEEAA